MPSPAWEDLDEFLDPEDGFGDIARFFPDAPDPHFDVVGIFDDPYFNAGLGQYDYGIRQPRFHCKEVDIMNITRGMLCEIIGKKYQGKKYQVEEPKPDGTGMADVFLGQVQVRYD